VTERGGSPAVEKRLAVIMAGPLPPVIGGMASVLDGLRNSSLAGRVDLRFFDTGKQTAEGRPLWQGIQARIGLMWKWWKTLAEPRNLIVHIHTCSGLTFFLDTGLLLLARLRGRPVILHVHGARFDEFLDSLSAGPAIVARIAAKSSAAVIALSDDWRDRLETRLPGANVVVVENGIPIPSGIQPSDRRETVNILFLGNLGVRKGVPELLDAFAELRRPCRLLMAGGEEDPGYIAWARDRCRKLGIDDRVDVLGPVVGNAKLSLFASADVFVLPSRAEGLPMALLEAMGHGLPPVVTRVGAMPSVVSDGQNGLLVDSGDVPALALALDRISGDADLRRRLAAAARVTCSDRFGVERSVDKLMALYGDVRAPGRPDDRAPRRARHGVDA
jgi:glycosyltransferase involved in cell wall biosynthesis